MKTKEVIIFVTLITIFSIASGLTIFNFLSKNQSNFIQFQIR